MEIVSRTEAKELGLKKFYTGRPCKRGHISPRHVKSGSCVECGYIHSRSWLETNKEQKRKLARDCYNKYRDQNVERRRTGRANNPEREAETCRKWRQRNPDQCAALSARRRAVIGKATPTWADHDQIRMVYEECRRRTKETGVEHHVDHIVPLNGKNVSGLHVHWNLQIITKSDNMKKGNKFE